MYNTYIVPFTIFAFSSSLCHYLLVPPKKSIIYSFVLTCLVSQAAVQHWFLIPSISFYNIYSASSFVFYFLIFSLFSFFLGWKIPHLWIHLFDRGWLLQYYFHPLSSFSWSTATRFVIPSANFWGACPALVRTLGTRSVYWLEPSLLLFARPFLNLPSHGHLHSTPTVRIFRPSRAPLLASAPPITVCSRRIKHLTLAFIAAIRC
ncbi:hypothetical protein BDV41DRAFT_71861 [Aspergillus transmontanensis]|uniref:Uncharacterized protein n=1 Tax=Aspergillus transmontanensis TaxID=1034304 RepID=A0A5N6VG04_9EURO|nr:hypothetical protein BDV41DRAFT_71861 [Aspergillus transmontanensis]